MAKIYLNEDNSHYFYKRKDKSANIEEITNFINQYKDSNIGVFLMCPNCQVTSFQSESFDCISENIEKYKEYLDKNLAMKDWVYGVKDIIDKDMDIYEIWIKLLRKINIKPYISMRMNDVHNANDEDNILHSTFYKKNLNYRRAMYRDSGWEDRQLNYLIKEVRDYHMKLVDEYFRRYNIDGIEIDWMRFGNHFPTGFADEGREVLSNFMKEVREKANKYEKIRGHSIKVGTRCPIKPETAFDLGMDVIYWAKMGYIDYVAPSPFWQTSQGDIPIEMWKYLLDGTKCTLVPCLELCLRPYIFEEYKGEYQYNSIETLVGPACSFLDRQADDVYLFNYMDMQYHIHSDNEYKEIVNTIGNYKKMKQFYKRYIVTFNDRKPDGISLNIPLPKILDKNVFTEYRVHTGNMKDECEKYIASSFKMNSNISDNDVEVYVNGCKCVYMGKYKCNKPYPVDALFRWKIPKEAFKNGYQVIEYVAAIDGLTLDWVEMFIS